MAIGRFKKGSEYYDIDTSGVYDSSKEQSQAAINQALSNGVDDLKINANYNEDCDRRGLIPYSANGSYATSTLTIAQNGNDITLNGASNATAKQITTKVLLSDHIEAWNNSATPTTAQVYTIPLLSGHTYKLKSTIVSGTRSEGEGSNRILTRLVNSSDTMVCGQTIEINQTTSAVTYTSAVDEDVAVRLLVTRGMTCTDLVVRIELSDITNEKAMSLSDLIAQYKNENGVFDTSFTCIVPLSLRPTVLMLRAKYTGEMPTISFKNDTESGTDLYTWYSPKYELGKPAELTRKSWRLPMKAATWTRCKINFDIPDGTVVEIDAAEIMEDQKPNDLPIKIHGHAGVVAPANSLESFKLGAEIGYSSMITIPHFTTDGVAVCFHDDTTISGSLCWMDGTKITGSDDKSITAYSYTDLTQNFRINTKSFGVMHVPTLEDYFRCCSLTGMSPILSIHSASFGIGWNEGFAAIKELAKKWGVLHKLGIKSGSQTVHTAARQVFGTDIDCYIFLNGTGHAPNAPLATAKGAGFIKSTATDLSECLYKLKAEYYDIYTSPSGAYYEQTMSSINESLGQGFIISIAEYSTISGPEMERIIGLGATEFTVDHHISMGLDW